MATIGISITFAKANKDAHKRCNYFAIGFNRRKARFNSVYNGLELTKEMYSVH